MARFVLHSKGPLDMLLRLVGLIVVMGLVVLGFWKNSERNLERVALRLEEKNGLEDPARTLDADQRAHVLAFIAGMRRTYGLSAQVRISPALGPAPELDAKTLCLEIGAQENKARVTLPPLMAGALGEDFARGLAEQHFPFHFGPGRDWRNGLLAALDLIENRLAALGAQQPPNPAAHKDAP
jgi:hypothetical protein